MKLIISLLLIPLSISVMGQVTANFTASSYKVFEGEQLQFIDSSGGNPTFWYWEFEGGDPSFSYDRDPKVTYTLKGAYSVKLISSNGSSGDTILKENLVHVYRKIWGDTLNYPLAGTDTIYPADSGGYITGNNYRKTIALAQKFAVAPYYYDVIDEIFFDFKKVTGSDSIEVFILNSEQNAVNPGIKLFSKMISLADIANDIAADKLTKVPVNGWYAFNYTDSSRFYIGFYLPDNFGDTLVVASNKDGETIPGRAWEMQSDSSWVPFSDTVNSWGLNISLGIFATYYGVINKVEDRIMSSGTLNIYPNPSTGVVTIEYRNMETEVLLEIYDLLGKKYYSFPNAHSKTTLNIPNLPTGTYLLMVSSDRKVVESKPFIISK